MEEKKREEEEPEEDRRREYVSMDKKSYALSVDMLYQPWWEVKAGAVA